MTKKIILVLAIILAAIFGVALSIKIVGWLTDEG